ncbi:hypothetical protein V8E36_006862 [Tilletia maclaganii]
MPERTSPTSAAIYARSRLEQLGRNASTSSSPPSHAQPRQLRCILSRPRHASFDDILPHHRSYASSGLSRSFPHHPSPPRPRQLRRFPLPPTQSRPLVGKINFSSRIRRQLSRLGHASKSHELSLLSPPLQQRQLRCFNETSPLSAVATTPALALHPYDRQATVITHTRRTHASVGSISFFHGHSIAAHIFLPPTQACLHGRARLAVVPASSVSLLPQRPLFHARHDFSPLRTRFLATPAGTLGHPSSAQQ